MISRDDIAGLAKLARLNLSEAELEALGKDVSNILEYVGQVSSIEGNDSGPVAPAHHNIMRDDTPRAEGDPIAGKEEAIRAQFPTRDKDYNVVRKILQKDE
jgi:aspartyl-tRNA(Asn)/glutamyl-tRNA(Gln) amidotransferase subunit C